MWLPKHTSKQKLRAVNRTTADSSLKAPLHLKKYKKRPPQLHVALSHGKQSRNSKVTTSLFFAINTAAKREASTNDRGKKMKNTGLFLQVTKLQHATQITRNEC